MIRPFTCICMLLAAGSGLYLYQSKHHALMLDRNINKVLNSVDAARQRTGLLRAEYALLNDPSRLSDLATQLLPKLQTTAPSQFTTMADLDKRLPPVGLPAEPATAPLETDAVPVASADQAPPPATPDPAPAVVADAVKPAAPHIDTPHGDTPHIETARIDPPRQETPRQEPARVETARNDTMRNDAVRSVLGRTDAPKPEQAPRSAAIAALPPRPAPQQVAMASLARQPASTQRAASTMQPTSLLPPPMLPVTPVVARVSVPPRPVVTPAVARVTPQRQFRTQLPPATPPSGMNGGITQVRQIEPRPRMVGSALGMAREMVMTNPAPAYPASAYPASGYGYGR